MLTTEDRNAVNKALGYNYLADLSIDLRRHEGEWKHYDSIAPSKRTAGPATDPITNVHTSERSLVCGSCHYPLKFHPIEFLCSRTSDSELVVGYVTEDEPYGFGDYWLHRNGEVEFIVDYSGNGVTEPVTDDWSDSQSELLAQERYRDIDPQQQTHAVDWWYVTPTTIRHGVYDTPKGPSLDVTNQIDTDLRNAYVEGNDGFSSRQLLDEQLTQKYHNRLLNIFVDGTGSIRIGSIRISRTVDGGWNAKCVRGTCSASLTAAPDVTRENMELFVSAVIRHGNNHAAKWFVERPAFYKVHADGCDLTCDSTDAHCNVKAGATQHKPTDNYYVAFLQEHQRYCKDAACTCVAHLAMLMPKPEPAVITA